MRITKRDIAQTERTLERLIRHLIRDSRLHLNASHAKECLTHHPCIELVTVGCFCQCCTHNSSFLLSSYFAHGSGAPGYSYWLFIGDLRQYVMTTVEELLTRLVNLENEAVQARQRQSSAEQALAAAQQRIAQLSSGTDVSTTPPGVIDTRTLEKPKSFSGQSSEWTSWQFTFKAFACAVHPKMKEVFELATRKGADPVNASDITGELQSLSTQLYFMLVMMLSDQAQEIVRNSPEGIGAEVWRKLLWEYEPGVGIRYGAMLQSLLKERFGEHDETDLAREIESFERDISKYEQQSNDLISDAIKHGIVCGGMAHQGLKQHIDLSISRLSTYKVLRDDIINYSRARRTWTDPNAMQVDAVHVNVNQERQGGSSGSRFDKGYGGKGGRSKSKKGGKGKEEKAASKFDGECRYCQKRGHKKADCRKMKSDIDAGRCDKSGKPTGVNALTAAGSTQPSRKRATHQA